jgi:hypothetical protein
MRLSRSKIFFTGQSGGVNRAGTAEVNGAKPHDEVKGEPLEKSATTMEGSTG